MEHPRLDKLYLTQDDIQSAQDQVSESAYFKWLDAGCPGDQSLHFWLQAELEWIEYRYVPDRKGTDEDLHPNEVV